MTGLPDPGWGISLWLGGGEAKTWEKGMAWSRTKHICLAVSSMSCNMWICASYHPYLGWWSCLCPHATFHGGWTCWTHPLQIMIAAWKPAETTHALWCKKSTQGRILLWMSQMSGPLHFILKARENARPVEMPSVCRSQVVITRVIAVIAQIRSIGQGGRHLFEKQLIHTVAARSLATQVPDACSGVWRLETWRLHALADFRWWRYPKRSTESSAHWEEVSRVCSWMHASFSVHKHIVICQHYYPLLFHHCTFHIIISHISYIS